MHIVGQMAESSLSPCWSSAITPRLFQKAIEGFEPKINGRALAEKLALCENKILNL